MREMTRKNLSDAFAGESQAHVRYLVYADMAEREGLKNIARLFRAAAFSEQIHATNHLKVLGGVGLTAKNLDTARGGEDFEITEMYPTFANVAELQVEKSALKSMRDAWEAEKVHSKLYGQAQQAAADCKDAELPEVWVCNVCGYTMEGEAPERCPICGTIHTRFTKF